jgi:hypothetical protein
LLGRNGFLEGVESQIKRHPADVESIKLDELASHCIEVMQSRRLGRDGEGDVL